MAALQCGGISCSAEMTAASASNFLTSYQHIPQHLCLSLFSTLSMPLGEDRVWVGVGSPCIWGRGQAGTGQDGGGRDCHCTLPAPHAFTFSWLSLFSSLPLILLLISYSHVCGVTPTWQLLTDAVLHASCSPCSAILLLLLILSTNLPFHQTLWHGMAVYNLHAC